jgi:capsular polysaccharide biosynthesis protein
MEENNVLKPDKSLSFLKVIYRYVYLIIAFIITTTSIGLAYGLIFVEPVYTVSRSFILSAPVAGGSASNSAALGKFYITQVESLLLTPEYVNMANNQYKELKPDATSRISAKAISVKYNDDSLIFTISFKDTDQDVANAKLHAVYLTALNKLEKDMSISNLTLIDTENVEIDFNNNIYKGVTVSVDNGVFKCIIMGFLAGFIISIGMALIAFVLDNTIHDKEEFEQMTGISVIAYVEKVKKSNQKA